MRADSRTPAGIAPMAGSTTYYKPDDWQARHDGRPS